LIEEWGSRYNRSIVNCAQLGYPQPEWQEMGSSIRVIFWPHPSFRDYDELNVPINDRQIWFVEELKQGKKLKSSDLAKR
jgi:hypothetical protein